ncbi:MAG TPA: non-canonical purine NTP pyrophosphatase [Gemmatimonadaceae bacterium]|nr:non-canonical purine NTP pyrophosphatase [Gemmatimonadaceae bacterium]
MTTPSLFFATSNDYKFAEFSRLFGAAGLQIDHYRLEVEEVQHIEMDVIVRDKALKAYQRVRRPVLVDHSGLAMNALNGLPCGLNKLFWNVLQDRICELAIAMNDPTAEILVSLALCDGKRIHAWHERLPGNLAAKASAVGTFHLDRVFVPNGSTMTLAEMSTVDRDVVSHRRRAVDHTSAVLKSLAVL